MKREREREREGGEREVRKTIISELKKFSHVSSKFGFESFELISIEKQNTKKFNVPRNLNQYFSKYLYFKIS